MAAPLTAADYEQAIPEFFYNEEFDLARRCAARAKELRAHGDTSAARSEGRFTPEEYEEAAREWLSEGRHEDAQQALRRAAELRAQQKPN